MSAKIYDFMKEKRKRDNSAKENFSEKCHRFYSEILKEEVIIKEENNYTEEELIEIRKGNFMRPLGVFK